jgi:hypothetical protein
MRDHTKLRAFKLADEVAVLLETRIVEAEKVLNGLIRALRDD